MRLLAALGLILVFATPAVAAEGLHEYVGALHDHSAYSDGWPGTRPADVFASGKRYGLDFLGISDHSDNMGIPLVFSEACYGQGRGGDGEVLADKCLMADQVNPADSFRKWDATGEQAQAASSSSFSGLRGFEWSSDRYGHLNVFFSSNWTGAYQDGGFVDMATFWSWFERPPSLGGGLDGIGTFNHPGAKDLEPAPGFNWNDFAYQPAADERMVGVEVFNDKKDYGSEYYAHVLDKGWHVGAIGAEDLGHRKPPLDNWGGPQWAKTVVIASSQAPADLKAALLARRFYAIGPDENALRLAFTVDGQRMGTRLDRETGDKLDIAASASDTGLRLELITSGGKTVASAAGGELTTHRKATTGERWYFVRALRGDKVVAWSSPVWVRASAERAEGMWLAGDMHVHTCYSHDAYCGPTDDNTGPDTFYSSGGTVGERFGEAAAKGLDFLNVSDHDDIRAWTDPDFGAHGVTALHGYEASLPGGHAHIVGVDRQFDKSQPVQNLKDDVNADGGIFQANHPSYRIEKIPETCDQMASGGTYMHWKYGFTVQPDSLEVWNPTALLAPAEAYWECWLERGVRMPATAGSDTHGALGQVGTPTTWVFSRSHRERDIVRGIVGGRTSLSRLSPALGGLRLLLEADSDGDGKFESMIGDTVKPGSKLRVRAEGLPPGGYVRVRANGKTLVDDAPLQPGSTVTVTAPKSAGWVRAVLYLPEILMSQDPGCSPNESPVSICSHDFAVAAMTSPIYLGRPEIEPLAKARALTGPAPTELDSEAPLRPARQSKGG